MVIPFTSTQEPSLTYSTQAITSNIQFTLHKVDTNDLLQSLVYDSSGSQIRPLINTTSLQLITSFSAPPANGSSSSKIDLPIKNDLGTWVLTASEGETTTQSVIIRTKTGVIAKEGDNQYILWARDFDTKRSKQGGSYKIYSLAGSPKELTSGSFDESGLATTNLTKDADIALVEFGDDKTILPINLLYLNSSQDYDRFSPKTIDNRYFIFTDRPIYKPGDTVYFKSIIRLEDDVRYSIPEGLALVTITQGYSSDDPIFQQTYPISPDGTVSGEFALPADSKVGNYQINVDRNLQKNKDNYWEGGYQYFDVQFYRKPEYTLDLSASDQEIIKGDKIKVNISGLYFFGQPLANQKVKYKLFSEDYYDYAYFREISDNSRWGWYGNSEIKSGEIQLDNQGEALLEIGTSDLWEDATSKIVSVEVTIDDGTSNPTFERKNILVRAGELSIYRKEGDPYFGIANQNTTLSFDLHSFKNKSTSGLQFNINPTLTYYTQYDDPNSKYPKYERHEEDLNDIQATSNSSGELQFQFTPTKEGNYKFAISTKDSLGNQIEKSFYLWVYAEDKPFLTDESPVISIRSDKDEYLPTDNAKIYISSEVKLFVIS